MQGIYVQNLFQNLFSNSYHQTRIKSAFPSVNIFNYGNIGNINLGNLFGGFHSPRIPRTGNHKRPVYIDKEKVEVKPKKCLQGYTAQSYREKSGQSIDGGTGGWSENSVKQIFSSFDADHNGVMDINEEAAMRAIYCQGTGGIWTAADCNNMQNDLNNGTVSHKYTEILNKYKSQSESEKENNIYYKTAERVYNDYKISGKSGLVG